VVIRIGPLSGFTGLVLGAFRNALALDVAGKLVRVRPREVERASARPSFM
jgi:hypothetical protein